MDNCEQELREHCIDIRDRLEELADGKLYDTETGDMIEPDDLPEDYDETRYHSLFDYLSENYGISITKWIGDEDKDFRWCCIIMATGGPGIYIDTGDGAVQGRWGSAKCDIYLNAYTIDAINNTVMEMIY